MRFIDKSKVENRIKGLAINRQILELCWNESARSYSGLNYDDVDKTSIISHIVGEQDGLCCYCMRNLHVKAEGNHRKNTTLEHVIPHKIREQEWLRDRDGYRMFPLLKENHIAVCYGGMLNNASIECEMPPFPHFIAYDNLVASCDGQTLNEIGEEIPQHCCNNKRGNSYVEPLYFHAHISSEVSYDNRGHVQCREEFIPYLGENGVNIMCPFLNKVRLFWKEIFDSEYDVTDIVNAEDDETLRLDIIDDVFTDDPTGQWFFLEDKKSWCVFSDYPWFYEYYKSRQ